MSKDSWLNIEKLFYEISVDWFKAKELSYESDRRSGVFSAALTIWLMILQRLSGIPLQGALIDALNGEDRGIFSKLNKNSKKLAHGTVSNNSGGFSRARDRIGAQDISDLIQHCEVKLGKKLADKERLYLLDGTCITTAYSAKNEQKYPRHSVGKDKTVHYPRLRAITVHSLSNGTALEPIHGTIKDSEQALTWKYLPQLPKNSSVIGDRNFGVFSVAYRADSLGHKALLRLNEAVFKRVVGNKAELNMEVSMKWLPSHHDRKATPEIPQEACIQGRFIKFSVETPGFCSQVLYFFTTLNKPASEIATLYLQRQRIETHISQLKQILKLEFISAKTPERIQKELSIAFLTFNLISAIMAAAAQHNDIPFARISFTAAIRIITAYAARIHRAVTPAQRSQIIDLAYVAFFQTKLPLRKKRRSYPRVIKRNKSKFPTLAIVENIVPYNSKS